MTITVFTSAWNCINAGLVGLIDYYLNFLKVDKFIYADNYSTDDTIKILKRKFKGDKRLVIMNTPYITFSDNDVCALANKLYKEDINEAFIWVDSDEIVYHPDLRQYLLDKKKLGKYFISSLLVNVYNTTDTFKDNINILDNFEMCHEMPVQKSPIIIRSKDHDLRFHGGHHCISVGDVLMEWSTKDRNLLDDIAIFHFCYITPDFFNRRKTLPAKHLLKQGAMFAAISPGGWWLLDDATRQEWARVERSSSVTMQDFLKNRNLIFTLQTKNN